MREGFEADRDAMVFDGPALPVPAVLDIGEALGLSFAISVRHHGRFLEDIGVDEAERAGPMLGDLLVALRDVPATGPVGPHWRTWLLESLVDDRARRVSRWRAKLAADSEHDRLFRRCEARIADLVDVCPERRDLVHGDLLHQNVLVSPDASRVRAVFSWKCSTRGDFLYDTAWCTFWSPWHPGIAAARPYERTIEAVMATGSPEDLADAADRHHCYELQIGATHLAWTAWTGNDVELRAVADHTAAVLDRGPLRSS